MGFVGVVESNSGTPPIEGPQGPEGDAGPQGATGPTGATGATGPGLTPITTETFTLTNGQQRLGCYVPVTIGHCVAIRYEIAGTRAIGGLYYAHWIVTATQSGGLSLDAYEEVAKIYTDEMTISFGMDDVGHLNNVHVDITNGVQTLNYVVKAYILHDVAF